MAEQGKNDAHGGMSGGCLTLSEVLSKVKEMEQCFGHLDTHLFASAEGLNRLKRLFPPITRNEKNIVGDYNFHISSFAGMEVIHDPTVAANEIEAGRIEKKYREVDGKVVCDIRKVVTKVYSLFTSATMVSCVCTLMARRFS